MLPCQSYELWLSRTGINPSQLCCLHGKGLWVYRTQQDDWISMVCFFFFFSFQLLCYAHWVQQLRATGTQFKRSRDWLRGMYVGDAVSPCWATHFPAAVWRTQLVFHRDPDRQHDWATGGGGSGPGEVVSGMRDNSSHMESGKMFPEQWEWLTDIRREEIEGLAKFRDKMLFLTVRSSCLQCSYCFSSAKETADWTECGRVLQRVCDQRPLVSFVNEIGWAWEA